MSNPSRKHTNPVYVHGSAQPSTDDGSGATRHQAPSAGGAERLPQQLPVAAVFDLLLAALDSFQAADPPYLAAGVAARMKRIDPGFSQRASGFSSFRALLREAEASGLVVLDPGASPVDIGVTKVVGAGSQRADRRVTKLRDDVWKAFLNWDPDVAHAFDRVLKRPYLVTDSIPAGDVQIPSVSKALHSQWMRDFAASETDPAVLTAIDAAVSDVERIRAFSEAIRSNPEAGRRWKRRLRLHVLDRATEWSSANGISPDDLGSTPDSPVVLRSDPQSREVLTGDARERILAILASMPTGELLRLPIPVEYALRN